MDIRFNHIKRISSTDTLDLNNSLLIIGRAANNNLSEELLKAKNIDEIYDTFGESELSRAAEYALNLGLTEVYLYNTYETENYLTVADKFVHYEFSYIVPIGIYLSDNFYNPITRSTMLYADFYLSSLAKDTCSTIIMTDKHAELYEDLDNFLIAMEDLVEEVKTDYQTNALTSTTESNDINKWTNLIFVSNMLSNVEYSNIRLACELIKCTPGTYPSNISEKAVFDYDSFDFTQSDMCYFRNNILSSGCSIENLLNMRVTQDAYKSVIVDMIIKYIRRNLDLSKYSGRFFTKYTKVQISNDLKSFMSKLTGTMIKNYTIKSINFVLTGPNVGNVLIETEITPRGTLEALQINLEV